MAREHSKSVARAGCKGLCEIFHKVVFLRFSPGNFETADRRQNFSVVTSGGWALIDAPAATCFPSVHMDHTKFDAALHAIIARLPRYDRAAYHFLREALEYTLKERKKATGQIGHVSGQQLMEGVRRLALKQFGPMVTTVFEYWGITTTEDFGHMVFALVEAGIFGKTERDSLADFTDVYSFHDAFVVPYQPAKMPAPARRASLDAAQELN
jgi:uncharacterized repeat protein (TIGR04138 family)